MIKQLALLIGLGLLSVHSWAQAFEGKVKYNKDEEPAIVIVYDFPLQVVENAIIAKLTDKQLTGSLNKGFYEYPNSVITEISKSKLDYFFKLEESGSGTAKKTTVYMVMHGSGNIEGIDQLADRGKAFMENMTKDVQRSDAINEIKKQEVILVQEEENLAALEKTQKDLEDKLSENKAKIEAQQKIITSQKMILDDLKSKY